MKSLQFPIHLSIQIEKSAVSYTPVNPDKRVCSFLYTCQSRLIRARFIIHPLVNPDWKECGFLYTIKFRLKSVYFLIHRSIQIKKDAVSHTQVNPETLPHSTSYPSPLLALHIQYGVYRICLLFFWLPLASASMTLKCSSSLLLAPAIWYKNEWKTCISSHPLSQRSSLMQIICADIFTTEKCGDLKFVFPNINYHPYSQRLCLIIIDTECPVGLNSVCLWSKVACRSFYSLVFKSETTSF